ncbi:hypothetical protein B0H14DRAFT_2598552 [Mycena olivaceomarginata]|nr:hypothetical protein B0H14DRAFT_2598552 [Mycena olivaceomarginata]
MYRHWIWVTKEVTQELRHSKRMMEGIGAAAAHNSKAGSASKAGPASAGGDPRRHTVAVLCSAHQTQVEEPEWAEETVEWIFRVFQEVRRPSPALQHLRGDLPCWRRQDLARKVPAVLLGSCGSPFVCGEPAAGQRSQTHELSAGFWQHAASEGWCNGPRLQKRRSAHGRVPNARWIAFWRFP